MIIKLKKTQKEALKKIDAQLIKEQEKITKLAEIYNSKVRIMQAQKQIILSEVLAENDAPKDLNWALNVDLDLQSMEIAEMNKLVENNEATVIQEKEIIE